MKSFLVLIFAIYSFKSCAGLLLEPYIGFDFSLSGKTSNGGTEVSWFNYEIGGRAGYKWDVFMLGLDMDFKNMDPSYEEYNSSFNQETNVTNMGIFAGWMWDKWALRLKYYFDSDWILQENGNYGNDGQTNTGYGFGIDGAYRFSKNFSLNLELTRITYNLIKGTKVSSGDRIQTLDLLISVSFPFDLVNK